MFCRSGGNESATRAIVEAASVGFSPSPWVTLLVQGERFHVPTRHRTFPNGSSTTRGFTNLVLGGEVRLGVPTSGRVSGYAALGIGGGAWGSNVDQHFSERDSGPVYTGNVGGGVRIRHAVRNDGERTRRHRGELRPGAAADEPDDARPRRGPALVGGGPLDHTRQIPAGQRAHRLPRQIEHLTPVERDRPHPHQRLTGRRSVAGHQVEDAPGQLDGLDHVGQHEGVKGRDLRGLDLAPATPKNVRVGDRDAARLQVAIDRGLVLKEQRLVGPVRHRHDVDVAEFRTGLTPVTVSENMMPPHLAAGLDFAARRHGPME